MQAKSVVLTLDLLLQTCCDFGLVGASQRGLDFWHRQQTLNLRQVCEVLWEKFDLYYLIGHMSPVD